jgi:hypothetical protein
MEVLFTPHPNPAPKIKKHNLKGIESLICIQLVYMIACTTIHEQ